MLQSKSEIKQRLTEILLGKQAHDQKFDRMHGLLTNNRASRLPVSRLREEFQRLIPELRGIVRLHLDELERHRYQSIKLQKEGNQMESTVRTIDSLKQYFQELDQKVKSEHSKGEEKLSERERWQLTQGGESEGIDQQSRLIMSAGIARETREMAQQTLTSLQNQTGRLQTARQKMGNVLRNINLSSNILHLVRSRSKEDNRLILLLSLGLIVEAFVCVYFIRPLVRG